jgi:hypothetical protein
MLQQVAFNNWYNCGGCGDRCLSYLGFACRNYQCKFLGYI